MQDKVIQKLVNHFIENNEINFSQYNVSNALKNFSSDSYPMLEDVLDVEQWITQLLPVEQISYRVSGLDFGTYKNFPEHLFSLTNLKSIDFAENMFETIPESILNFENLESISFANNNLTRFPEILTKHHKLKSVGLLGNPFVAYNFSFEYSKEIQFENLKNKLTDYYTHKSQTYTEFGWGVCVKRKEISIYIYKEVNFWYNCITIAVEKHIADYKIDQFKIYDEFKNIFKEIGSVDYINTRFYIGNEQFGDEIIRFYPPVDFMYWYSLNTFIEEKYNDKETIELVSDNARYTLYITDLIERIGGSELLKEIENEVAKKKKENAVEFKYIEQLNVYNYKLFEQIEITEISPSVNVVIGLNGAGKTTLLQAIALGFLHPNNSSNLFSPDFFNRKIQNTKDLSEDKKYCQIVFNQSYDKRYFINKDRPEIIDDNDINRHCIFLALGANLFSKEKLDHKEFAEKILKGTELPASYDTVYSIIKDYCEEFYNPLRILDELSYMERTSEINDTQRNEWKLIRKTLQETLNAFLKLNQIEKFQIEETGNKYSFVNPSGQWNLAELSEGYRTNTLLITDILIRILASRKNIFGEHYKVNDQVFKETKGYILIDEFDRHLHPVWQRHFLSKLKKKLPKIQFFVTTHNVFALQSAEGEKAIILFSHQKEAIKGEKLPKGWSVESIYRKFLGIKGNYTISIQENLDKFSAKINEIYENKLQENDPEFIKICKELLNEDLSESVHNIVNRELAQLKRITKKTVLL